MSIEETKKIAELKARADKLDKVLAARMLRTGNIEELLIKMANGKMALPNQQDCRVMALRLGTPISNWSDIVKNHQFSKPDDKSSLATIIAEASAKEIEKAADYMMDYLGLARDVTSVSKIALYEYAAKVRANGGEV